MGFSKEEVFSFLTEVLDPEVPVLNVVEMGIVRDVAITGKNAHVKITPTYSGCPAMKVIHDGIKEVLQRHGFESVEVETVFSPAWTTDWISDETKAKLREYGISPPDKLTEDDLVPFPSVFKHIPCPFCDSKNTEITSQFGSTSCKSLCYCNSCMQPFEHFKSI